MKNLALFILIATSIFKIELCSAQNSDSLNVKEDYDHYNQLLLNKYPICNDKENAHQVLYEIGDLKRGMYMIKLVNSSGQWKSQKLVVE